MKLHFKFNGKEDEDIHKFKRDILNHAKIYGIKSGDLCKLLLCNKYIVDAAFEHLHINMSSVNTNNPDADTKLDRMCKLLEAQYDSVDKVFMINSINSINYQ